MNRRRFLFSASGIAFTAWLAPAGALAATPTNPTDRIGMGTVLFRYRFRQTRPKTITPKGGDLTLLDVPQFHRDRFGLRNVEFWSNHFDSLEPAYLEKLRNRLEAAGSTLINVQVDSAYNLASTDEEERRRSVSHAMEWIDAAAFLGSTAIRINPGNASVEKSIESLKAVNEHAMERGLPLLTENHFGIEMDPAVHLRILDEVGTTNIHTLPDFGNYPDDTRFAALEQILPRAYLVSAKTVSFNDRGEHVSYDFDACVRMAEEAGFRGIYSVEQWSREEQDIDYEKVGDWMINHVRTNLAGA